MNVIGIDVHRWVVVIVPGAQRFTLAVNALDNLAHVEDRSYLALPLLVREANGPLWGAGHSARGLNLVGDCATPRDTVSCKCIWFPFAGSDCSRSPALLLFM